MVSPVNNDVIDNDIASLHRRHRMDSMSKAQLNKLLLVEYYMIPSWGLWFYLLYMALLMSQIFFFPILFADNTSALIHDNDLYDITNKLNS